MKTKMKIMIISVSIILILMVIIFIRKENKEIENKVAENKVKITHSKDENTGEYIIYRNGEEKARVMDEAEIKVYEDNPDYDPKF